MNNPNGGTGSHKGKGGEVGAEYLVCLIGKSSPPPSQAQAHRGVLWEIPDPRLWLRIKFCRALALLCPLSFCHLGGGRPALNATKASEASRSVRILKFPIANTTQARGHNRPWQIGGIASQSPKLENQLSPS